MRSFSAFSSNRTPSLGKGLRTLDLTDPDTANDTLGYTTSKMPPAEFGVPETVAAVAPTGYHGKNMTLPASWWTSSSLFQLERRAIFAKVLPSLDTSNKQDMALRNAFLSLR
jgi:hypothetical protein